MIFYGGFSCKFEGVQIFHKVRDPPWLGPAVAKNFARISEIRAKLAKLAKSVNLRFAEEITKLAKLAKSVKLAKLAKLAKSERNF